MRCLINQLIDFILVRLNHILFQVENYRKDLFLTVQLPEIFLRMYQHFVYFLISINKVRKGYTWRYPIHLRILFFIFNFLMFCTVCHIFLRRNIYQLALIMTIRKFFGILKYPFLTHIAFKITKIKALFFHSSLLPYS